MYPADIYDGGFAINLMSNDLLVFSTYDQNNRLTQEFSFALPRDVQMRYLRMVSYAAPWLRNVPLNIQAGEDPVSEHTFGFYGHELLRMEDLSRLLDCPYRSKRGHYARLVYALLEDISALMADYGIDLQPCGFQWNPNMIQPLIQPQPNVLNA